MITELTTDGKYPVFIEWDDDMIYTEQLGEGVEYTRTEAIQLRDFLNQLELGE